MEVLNDLVAALKARLPGIHLRTIEEARALEALRQTTAALSGQLVPRVLWRWSSASGLWKLRLNDDEPDRSLREPCGFEEALVALRDADEMAVLALLDPWDELSRPVYQRYLREALANGASSTAEPVRRTAKTRSAFRSRHQLGTYQTSPSQWR